MNKKLTRLMEPSVAVFFLLMILFAAATFLWQMLQLNLLHLAVLEIVITVFFFFIYRMTAIRRKRELMKLLQTTMTSADAAAGDTFHMPLPMAVVTMEEHDVIWGNSLFQQMTGHGDELFARKLTDIFPDFALTWLIEGKQELPDPLVYEGHHYRVLGNTVHSDSDGRSQMLASLYFVDVTDFITLKEEYTLSRPVVSVILVDNYDELTNNLPDTAVSTINAEIDAVVTEWAGSRGAILRKVERNRYLYIFEQRSLRELTDEKFSILESIRKVVNRSGIAATVSIGIGRDGGSFQENYDFAALSLETALARGGDQVVIKNRYNFLFYGGKAQETERRTKVRSRVMAGSLNELIEHSSQVFVMGHKNADLDAVGAAAGIVCLCRKKGKPVHVVIDRNRNAAEQLITRLEAVPQYEKCFISPESALLAADSKSLLVVVDTNRPDQVESRELLESLERVAVIDHHRRAAEFIEQVVMNLHEPFASSASELVTELLTYSLDTGDILNVDAEALLAGIVLDTKNFSVRTGGRTFEAAAFLRRAGADTVNVKKLFQSNLDSALSRYRILQGAKLYRGEIAIAAMDVSCDRVIAAQAADELLNIQGILTSFVLYPDGTRVIISARSIGTANVQVILEPLGGGGNAATAGAQVPDKDMHTVLQELVQSIDKFYEG